MYAYLSKFLLSLSLTLLYFLHLSFSKYILTQNFHIFRLMYKIVVLLSKFKGTSLFSQKNPYHCALYPLSQYAFLLLPSHSLNRYHAYPYPVSL